MNVYDFDNTIYDGESTVDFFLMCMRRHPSLIRLLPIIIIKLIRYKSCKADIEEIRAFAEKYACKLIKTIGNTDQEVKRFWDKNMKKVKAYYIKQRKNDDLIVSAAPELILSEFSRRMGGIKYICSEIDMSTGKIGRICFGENKKEILTKEYPNISIDRFFTDSMNDRAVINMAKKAYLVKRSKIRRIK